MTVARETLVEAVETNFFASPEIPGPRRFGMMAAR